VRVVTLKEKPDFREYAGPDMIISSFEMLDHVKKNQTAHVTVKSQIPGLDAATKGFQTGELITISGPTKNGKTLFSQTLTRNFHEQQVFSLWFSFELPPWQFLNCFQDLPLIFMPKILRAADLNWLEDRIMESFQKYNTRVVFLDHLHYLFDLARTKSPSIEIGQVIRRLKMLAVRENLIIFLMCHTNKNGADNLSYQSIRDSSFVSQESDSVLMVKRTPEHGEKAARLRVEFHRRTGTMERVVNLVKKNGFLEEQEKEN
jgi:archaellum biogenesis ATPase FlaH